MYFYDLLGMMFAGAFSFLRSFGYVNRSVVLGKAFAIFFSPFRFSLLLLYCHCYWFTFKKKKSSVVFIVCIFLSDYHSFLRASALPYFFSYLYTASFCCSLYPSTENLYWKAILFSPLTCLGSTVPGSCVKLCDLCLLLRKTAFESMFCKIWQ